MVAVSCGNTPGVSDTDGSDEVAVVDLVQDATEDDEGTTNSDDPPGVSDTDGSDEVAVLNLEQDSTEDEGTDTNSADPSGVSDTDLGTSVSVSDMGNGLPEAAPAGLAAVSAGYWHSCGMRTDNTAVCWGYNEESRADAPSGTFITVSAGYSHSCGIRTDNTAVCWGDNG